jgi:hypothetical protein
MTPISKNEVEEILEDLAEKVRTLTVISGLTSHAEKELEEAGYKLTQRKVFIDQALEQITLLLERREAEARINELGVFMARLENNHHDMPIGTASQYVTEQYMNRLDELKASLNQGGE